MQHHCRWNFGGTLPNIEIMLKNTIPVVPALVIGHLYILLLSGAVQ
jgi:hypothetical protein